VSGDGRVFLMPRDSADVAIARAAQSAKADLPQEKKKRKRDRSRRYGELVPRSADRADSLFSHGRAAQQVSPPRWQSSDQVVNE
jgi:hypothetical protein